LVVVVVRAVGPRGHLLSGTEVVEEDQRVVFGGAGLGVVGDEVLSGCADELHGLVAEGDVADVGVVEGLVAVGLVPAATMPSRSAPFSGRSISA